MNKSSLNLKSILNHEQYLSVSKIEGPSLILAGAGSGKTRVITYKIAYLIDCGVAANKILAVTFTNKAAKEMKARVSQLVKRQRRNTLITTFHSLGLRILEKEITRLGYKDKFSIYDDKDSLKLLKDVLAELKIPEDQYDVYQLSYKISQLKMNLKANIEDETIKKIYKQYQVYLKIYNAVDFDDLIKLPIELFEQYPEVLKKYQNKWQYILVDEYQDTSLMQYHLMKMLAISHKNISIVGDDDQSIYSWRGANQNNITLFEKDFYPVFEVKLEQNYRSTETILKAANAVILNNANRREKNLWTKGKKGEKNYFYEAQNEEEEADFVLMMINRLVDEGYQYKDFGILFRLNSQSRPIEEKLRENNLPYILIGAMKFFERPEIRDILSYMRFLANLDDEVALIRIINNPKRGIGSKTVTALMEHAKSKNCSLFSTIKDFIHLNTLGSKITPYLEDFYQLIEKYRERIFKPRKIAQTIQQLVEDIDYQGKLVSELKVINKVNYRMSNINQLIQSIRRYETNPDNFEPNIYEYLQRISLNSREDENNDGNNINMLSIHSAKGLEFKVVFIVGVEEGLIPHIKTLEETGIADEERRLFYVAITRAREKLYMSYPKTRMKFSDLIHRESSSFLNEIPGELIEYIDLEEKLAEKDSFGSLLNKWNA